MFWHSLENKILTTPSNIFTHSNLTDMETCYKVFRRDILEQIEIQEMRFGLEPESTAKLARLGGQIYEMGRASSERSWLSATPIHLQRALNEQPNSRSQLTRRGWRVPGQRAARWRRSQNQPSIGSTTSKLRPQWRRARSRVA